MLRWVAAAVALLVISSLPAHASVVQQGNLRVTLLSRIAPFKLPRSEPAPISVFIAGHVAAVDGATPPQLRRLQIKVNRHGHLGSAGLPVCRLAQIQPATTARALSACGPALVGSGQFWARIVLGGQDPYPTRGRLLVFNGRSGGRPAIFVQIYTENPFATGFVIVFRMRHLARGRYGTELSASLPQALGTWGFVDRIKLTLKRKYRYRGAQRSYFSASCPAGLGTVTTVFHLAQATFSFAGQSITTEVAKACRVKGPSRGGRGVQ